MLSDEKRKKIILECIRFFKQNNLFYLLACGTACSLLKYGDVLEAPKGENDSHDIDFYVLRQDYYNIRPKIDPYFQDILGYKINKNAEFKIQMEKQTTNGKIMVEFYFTEILRDEGNHKIIKYSTNGDNVKEKRVSFDKTTKIDDETIKVVDKNYCKRYYSDI